MVEFEMKRWSCMLCKHMLRLCFSFILVGVPLGVCAAEKKKSAPGFYPNLALDLVLDDNIRRTEDNEVEDWYVRVRPKLEWVMAMARHELVLSAEIDSWRYAKESNEDAFDRYFLGELKLDVSRMLDINLVAGYSRSHTLRGHDPSAASVDPNLWKTWGVSGEAIYGRRANKMQLSLLVDHQEIEFLNNDLEGRNHDQDTIQGTVFYNWGPKTQLLFKVSRVEFDYDKKYDPIAPGGAELDSSEMGYHVGVNWDATYKTSGEFRIGMTEKDMDDSRLKKFRGLTTALNLVWRPKSYSTVDVLLERSSQETKQGLTSYVVSNQFSVDWMHELTRRLTMETGITLEYDKWSDIRDDELLDVYLGFEYSLRRWIDVGFRYTFQNRDSNLAGLDYDSNVLLFTVEAFRNKPGRPKRTKGP